MKIEKEKLELKKLIKNYIQNKASLDDLNQFAWNKIDYFATNKDVLPPYEENDEGEFWYAIWQIQHLVGEDHQKDEILKNELNNILDFFNKKKPLPKSNYGKRPA